jgi:serine/threonine protein phosphatase PrpC
MRLRSLTLFGRDYPELGPIGIASLPDGGALGLSRGACPKAYRHVDPNEDAAMLLRTGQGGLLAVADGYNGVRASELTIELLRKRGPDLIAAPAGEFEARLQAFLGDLAPKLGSARRSRCSLVLAILRGKVCQFASFGDCSLFRASDPIPQTARNRLVLGQNLRIPRDQSDLWRGRFTLEPDERIALVSDGITDFVPQPDKIHLILQAAADDRAAAQSLVEAALTGGAGDNVGVATIGALG